MKLRHCLIVFLLLLLAIPCQAATTVRAGTNISNYPNISSPSTNARYILELPGVTNQNISHQQLKLNMTQGLATVSYVNSTTVASTNGLAHTNFVNAQDTLVSNGVVTFVSIVIPRTNQTMLVLQQTPFSGSQWYVGSNSVPTTNEARSGLEFNAFWRSLRMGEVAAGGDILTLVGNGSNYWNNTNIGVCSIGFGSNAFVKADFSSVLGGSYNAILTNARYSVIGGGYNNLISSNAHASVIGGGGRNWINASNAVPLPIIACATIGGGSNNIIRGDSIQWSTIGGGGDNVINREQMTISGGFANRIELDGANSFIGGGINNFIGETGHSPGDAQASFLGGGSANGVRGQYSVLVGGRNNNLLARDDDYSAIVGGQDNTIGIAAGDLESKHAFIGGGFNNDIANECTHAVIVGGADNAMGGLNTNSFIGGGRFNTIGSNTKFNFIPGGERNTVNADYGFAIGTSNTVTAARAGAIGTTVTNVTAGSVTVGELISYNTPAVIAGVGSGSTNYTLQVTSPKMLLGSSNVNIVAVMQTITAKTHKWSVNITNLSADTWGITFSSATNRWKFQSWMYGTNAPTVLTNNTLLRLNGESEGTNTLVTYEYFAPGL